MNALLSRGGWSEYASHLLIIAAVSIGYESLFIHHWMNVVDEGLTLYAAMGVHRGGTLYRDVSFVFPPGHLLVAWIAYGLDPPGVILSRVLYAGFNVALCLVLYPLSRRLMPPRYALLGVLLVAVAAPLSHRAHLLFGYRYLVFSALALLAFAQRLRTGNDRWLFVAGLCVGVGVCFRLTPAFAASVGIGLGILVAGEPRRWLRDGACFAVGVAVVVLPVVAVFAQAVGLETLWREIVVRPVVMTDLQRLPLPDLALPATWSRDDLHDSFIAWLFRICAVVYVLCLAGLLVGIGRTLRARRRFESALLLALVTWGAVYFLRALGRSDEPHLSSAIPPFCIVLAFLLHRSTRALRRVTSERVRGFAALSGGSALLAAWVFLPGADRALSSDYRGRTPLEVLDGRVELREEDWWHVLTPRLREIRERTRPGDRVLDLSASPLFYALVDRQGPGYHDILMPGTFLDGEEELAFLERLKAAPPALAVLGAASFDGMESRSPARIAPQLMAWVGQHYGVVGDPEEFLLLTPRPLRVLGGAAPEGASNAAPPEAPPLSPLDSARPLDRWLAALASELDRYQVSDLLLRVMGLETRLGWFDGVGVFRHPEGGLAIGRNLAEVAGAGPGLEALREPLRFVLAHHQAHDMQSRIYTGESLARPENQRLREAQADVLAGITLTQSHLLAEAERTGGSGRWSPADMAREAPRGLELAQRLGSREGFETGGLSDALRLRLLQVGRDLGAWYVKVWICRTNVGEPENREILERTLHAIQADRSRKTFQPRFVPRTCETEDVFDLTLRAAERELARGDRRHSGPDSASASGSENPTRGRGRMRNIVFASQT